MGLLTNTTSFCNSNDFQLTHFMLFDDSVVSGYGQYDNQEHICDEQSVGFHIIQNDTILQARPHCGTCGQAWCDCD
jgi:hypothetical protein